MVAAVDELTQEEREVGDRHVACGQGHRGGGDHHVGGDHHGVGDHHGGGDHHGVGDHNGGGDHHGGGDGGSQNGVLKKMKM